VIETRTVGGASPATERTALTDGHHLALGAAANALILVAANFRGVFTFLIARLLGEAALGRFGLLFATTELLSKAGMLGLDSAIVPFVATRAAAGDRDGVRSLFRRSIALGGLASLALAVVAIPVVVGVARAWNLSAYLGGATVMLLALPGIAVARISTGASRAVLAMGNEFYSRGLTETWVTTGVFVIAVALGIRDAAPALAVVAGTTAAAVVAAALARRSLEPVRGDGPAGGMTPLEMLRLSAPTAGASLLGVLVMRIDVLLLGAFVGRAPGVSVETFGVYCAAAEIAGGMRKVRQVFDPIFAPVAATRNAGADRAALRETIAAPGRWVLAAQLPLVGTLLLGSGAVLAIYGEGFRPGAAWLGVLAVAHAANSFAGLVETLLMIERPRWNLVNAALTVALQAAAGALLIPRFGVSGAAIAMLVGLAGQGVLRFVELHHVFGWTWPWRSLQRPAVAFAVSFVPALMLRSIGAVPLFRELMAVAVFLGGYAAAWLLMGADPEDRAIWRRLRRRRSRPAA
jgi:O-antigen/teichoic acid export membrane protein